MTLDDLHAKISIVEYHTPVLAPHMTVAFVKLTNGFVLIGESAPADPDNFNPELGKKFAVENAIRKLWPFAGYLLCERLTGGLAA